jgi:hypothetical protein
MTPENAQYLTTSPVELSLLTVAQLDTQLCRFEFAR